MLSVKTFGVCNRDVFVSYDRDGFELLGAHDGTQPAASHHARILTPLRNGSNGGEAFSRRANTRHLCFFSMQFPDSIFCVEGGAPPEFLCVLNADVFVFDYDIDGTLSFSCDDNSVPTCFFEHGSPCSSRISLAENTGQGGFCGDLMPTGGGDSGSCKGSGHIDERVFLSQRIGFFVCQIVEQLCRNTAAPKIIGIKSFLRDKGADFPC